MSASATFEYLVEEDEGGNPQSAAHVRGTMMMRGRRSEAELTTRSCWEAVLDSMSAPVKELVSRDVYNIALVIYDCSLHDHAIIAIRSPVSTCRAVSLTVLNHTPQKVNANANSNSNLDVDAEISLVDDAKAWLEKYSNNPDETDILQGEEGFAEILQRDSVDAVYIFVPADLQRKYVLAALQAGKHVLLKDLVSTPSKDYREQLEFAKASGKFIQFSTMFVHHYRVQTFLDCVSAKKTFGSIKDIDAILIINLQDLEEVHVSLPLTAGQGCIRRLARYCVLISTLMLRSNHFPVRATVTDNVTDETSGEPIAANCQVEFSGGAVLKCNVLYSDAPTRQVLTVRSGTNKYATMTDFLIPHPDGLATYRVYDKELNEYTGKLDIVKAECLDVPTGPPQNVTLWREFHQTCSSVERFGWSDAAETEEARVLTESSLQTKRILMALDESFQNNGVPVDIQYRPSHVNGAAP